MITKTEIQRAIARVETKGPFAFMDRTDVAIEREDMRVLVAAAQQLVDQGIRVPEETYHGVVWTPAERFNE